MKFTFSIAEHNFRSGEEIVVIHADGVPCGTIVSDPEGIKVLSAHITRVDHASDNVIDDYRFVMKPRRWKIVDGRKVYVDPQ